MDLDVLYEKLLDGIDAARDFFVDLADDVITLLEHIEDALKKDE